MLNKLFGKKQHHFSVKYECGKYTGWNGVSVNVEDFVQGRVIDFNSVIEEQIKGIEGKPIISEITYMGCFRTKM